MENEGTVIGFSCRNTCIDQSYVEYFFHEEKDRTYSFRVKVG